MAYMHIMGTVRAIRQEKRVREAWQTIHEHAAGRKPGVRTVYSRYLQVYDIEESQDGLGWVLQGETVSLIGTDYYKLGHALREKMRHRAL